MGLTVVTHTDPRRNRDITRCLDSVRDALPENSRHEVIECAATNVNEYAQARFAATRIDDQIVFVDDDDYISPDSLWMCLAAINDTNVGLAFTNEVIVAPNLNQRVVSHAAKYEMIGATTQIIHHMAMFNAKFVTTRSFDLAVKYGCGIDWAMRSEAALFHGAVHVPINGYFWVHHSGQHHKEPSVLAASQKNLDQVGKEIRNWTTRTGQIPTWMPKR